MVKRVITVLFMAVAVSISGCGKADRQKTSTEEVTTAEKEENSAEQVTEDILNDNAEQKLLYCITSSPDDSDAVVMQNACIEEGEKAGYTVKCVYHNGDTAKQAKLFDEAVSEKASAVICNSADADSAITDVQNARNAGIPTFLVNSEINQEGTAVAQILSDDSQGVAEAAGYLAETTGGEGLYLELLEKENRKSQLRSEAFHAVIDRTNMEMAVREIAGETREEGMKKTETLLKQYPAIRAVICENDELACGAADAVASENLDHEVYIIGFGGTDDMRNYIKDGKCLVTVLQQIDNMTRDAVGQAEEYLKTGSTGLEEKQLTDCVLITTDTADNLNNFAYQNK